MDGRSLVAWNLRRLRVAQKVSQERLAFDTGVDRAYVSGLEGAKENPTIDLLERLAKNLGAPLSELFIEPESGALPPAPLKGGRPARA